MKAIEMSDLIDTQEHSTINHLRLENMEDFLTIYDPIAYYVSPFSVLAQLESKVKFNTQPKAIISCTYKPDGEVMFGFVDQKENGNLKIVTYRYLTHV